MPNASDQALLAPDSGTTVRRNQASPESDASTSCFSKLLSDFQRLDLKTTEMRVPIGADEHSVLVHSWQPASKERIQRNGLGGVSAPIFLGVSSSVGPVGPKYQYVSAFVVV